MLNGLHVNLYFEGGELGIAEEENDAERGEIEEEDEEGSGEDRWTEEWQSNVCPNVERVRAKGAGGGFEFWVEAGEGIADDADNDGGVVKDVGKQDKVEG